MTAVEFPHERWFSRERFDGYGSIAVVRHAGKDCLVLKPMTSRSATETHAALLTSVRSWADFDATFADVCTIEQLRERDAPNPWERAWLLWHLRDCRHFYYFLLKTNGWELGKRDPAYLGGQRFLATGEYPAFAVGTRTTVRVGQIGATMTIAVDGQPIVTFTDRGDAATSGASGHYDSGRFGFYCEDAHVRFGGFSVREP